MPSETTFVTNRVDANAAYQPHIPEAVRRASARADELAREAGIANVPAAPETPGNGQDKTANEIERNERPISPPPFELTPPPVEEPIPAAAPQPVQAPMNDWEQRYNTLQGKYNTEMPELRGQLRAMQDMLANMQTHMRQPEPRAPETTFERPAPTYQRPQPPPIREIPKEDVDNYGSDLIDGVGRWAEARFAPLLQEIDRRLLSVEGGNQQLANYTAQKSVDAMLTQAVPDWDQVNHDPNFILWLDQVDMLSGRKRKELIDEAYGAGNAPRTIAFFRAYKNEQTVVNPNGQGTRPVQTGNIPADRLPLADLVVPGRGQSVTAPAPGAPEQRIWTAADIAAFNRQKQQGRWIGREAEAARIEADYMRAPLEGRFRQI
jgi:hypothetical protein